MNHHLLSATAAALRSFAEEYGGQYDLRDPLFPNLRFAHPIIGEAHVMRDLQLQESSGTWSFVWQASDFVSGRRRTAGGFRRTSGAPGDTMDELLHPMCEITVLDTSMLTDDMDEIAAMWRQQMAPDRKEELLASNAECYPSVDFVRLLERVGSPRPVPGAEWKFDNLVFSDGEGKFRPVAPRHNL